MSCLLASSCRNSTEVVGEENAKCDLCRLSSDNIGRTMSHYWVPIGSAHIHPLLEEEKRKKKLTKRINSLNKKRSRDPSRRKISRQASLAEKKTQSNIIHATKNSGRSNKDGDHVHLGLITLDTKLQTTRDNPVIFLAELEKVREDSKRAGNMIGGLVIRNKHNVGCVVLKEEDYVKLTSLLCNQ